MAERNEQVFARVRQELDNNPTIGSRDLYEIGQGVDKSLSTETLQQFHARYVLPIKREEAARKGGGRRRPRRRGRKPRSAERTAKAGNGEDRSDGRSSPERERVRGVLLDFARDFAEAESRAEIVQVLSKVDDYVDRIAPT
ncbi:MAG: hypothetical protein WD737_07870 [Gemmatimonadota bacterium]